jgi:hypothetical protein
MRPTTLRHSLPFLVALSAAFASISPKAIPAQQAAAPAGQVIADWDRVEAPVSLAGQVQLAETTADGNAFGRVSARGGGALKGQLLFTLSEGILPRESGGFSVRVRAVGGGANARLLALDASNRVILQHRLDLQPGDRLQPVSIPWTCWRWGDDTGGGAAEVRRIGLRFDAAGGELHLDDLALTAPAPAGSGKEWLRQLAFGGRDARMVEADGLLVATDAVGADGELTDADLAAILGRMRRGRVMVRRLFGAAVRPVETAAPTSLLIFRQQADYVVFFESLGREWNVRISPPTGGGLTVGNFAATTFDPKQGANRPVFLHESVHAVFATDVRLLSGHERHSWLHEGVGSYVQMCLYPQSVDRRALAANFRRPIDPNGKGFFKPLGQVLGRKVPAQQYAQVGTLVAYLVDQKPQWMPVIAKSLAAGGTAEEAFQACGVSLDELQDAWLKWGAAKVGERGDAGALLPLPPEFATQLAAPAETK